MKKQQWAITAIVIGGVIVFSQFVCAKVAGADTESSEYLWANFWPAYLVGSAAVIGGLLALAYERGKTHQTSNVIVNVPEAEDQYYLWPPEHKRITRFEPHMVRDAEPGTCGWLAENAFVRLGQPDGAVYGDSLIRDQAWSEDDVHVHVFQQRGEVKFVRLATGRDAYAIL